MRLISEQVWRTAVALLGHYASTIDRTAGVKEANRKRRATLTIKALNKATKLPTKKCTHSEITKK